VNDRATNLLKKCLLSHPQLLLLSMENLHSKVDYFNTIPLPPQLPTSSSSNTTTTKPKTNYLNDDKSPPSLAARIAISAPSVYSLSLADNILPTVECLYKAWCCGGDGNSEDGTSTFSLPFGVPLAEYPTVLTLSLEGNIIPTLQFYNQTGYITLDGEGRIKGGSGRVSYLPGRYIAASLFNRLLPRWNYCSSLNSDDSSSRDGGQVTNGTWMDSIAWHTPNTVGVMPIKNNRVRAPPLYLLAGATDEEFCQKMGFDTSSYLAYKNEAAPTLKFNTQFGVWLKTGRQIDES